jgi:hypothetical protein
MIHHNSNLREAMTFPLIVFSMIGNGAAPKCHFSQDSQVGNFKILEIRTFVTMETHNFLCKLPIEVKFEKMFNSLKFFQQYVACHLYARKSEQFPTFNGQESN